MWILWRIYIPYNDIHDIPQHGHLRADVWNDEFKIRHEPLSFLQTSMALKFPVLFFLSSLIGEVWAPNPAPQWHFSKSLSLLWNPSGGRHDIRAAWHELELRVSGGKNYGQLRSQVIESNESVAHSGTFFSHGLNSDCLDRLNYRVITKLSPGLIFQAAHIVLKFILALHSPVFIGYCGYGMNWAHALNLSDLYLVEQVTVCQSAPNCHKSLDF